MAVVYTLDGVDYQVDHLTLDEACEIEDELGVTWADMNPISAAKHARCILIRFLARDKGPDEARRLIGAMTIEQFTNLLTITVDGEETSPKEEPETPALEVLTS